MNMRTYTFQIEENVKRTKKPMANVLGLGGTKMLKYNNQDFALLEDGSLVRLYYVNKDGTRHSARNFYCDKNKWYLDHDKLLYGCALAYCHDEIKKFLTYEEALEIMEKESKDE